MTSITKPLRSMSPASPPVTSREKIDRLKICFKTSILGIAPSRNPYKAEGVICCVISRWQFQDDLETQKES